jgi:putative FmdB family regulatory protein
MPLYDFLCTDCGSPYDALSKYDETGEYPTVNCPKCGSGVKRKVPSRFNAVGTDTRKGIFENRAGHNLERAQGERRYAEEHSHMGTDVFDAIDDTHLDTGIHDNPDALDDAWL